MTKTLKFTLLALFLIQLVVASQFELAHDEAYYWVFSRHLDWGYFDHPPMMAVIIRLFSFLPHHELSVRIGFVVMQFLTILVTLSFIPLTKRLQATWLFFAFPLASFAGLLALPDMPLLFFTSLYFWGLKRLIERDRPSDALILGLIIACLLYSKYHGILLVFFTLLAMPRLFQRKNFYLVFISSSLLFLPHVLWQYQHDFQTFRYHFFDRPSAHFSVLRCLDYLGVQMILSGLLVGPLLWWRSTVYKALSDFERILKFCAIGIVLFFLISSFSKKVEANWTISLVVPFLILWSHDEFFEKRWVKNLVLTSAAIVLLARVLFILPPELTRIKRLREFHGWKAWAQTISEKCEYRPIWANTYQIAGKLSFYLERDVPALNIHSRKNQFDIWNFQEVFRDDPVCFVSDLEEVIGEPLPTPDARPLRLSPFVVPQDLLRLKAKL